MTQAEPRPAPAAGPREAPAAPTSSPDTPGRTTAATLDGDVQQSQPTPNEATSRPDRPPVVAAEAEIIAATRPGRIQLWAEKSWTLAALLAFVALVTAILTHGAAVDALMAQVTTTDPDETRRRAASILHFSAVGVMALGLLLEAIMVALLRRRAVLLRIGLTCLALLAIILLPLATDILNSHGWRGAVVRVCLVAHAACAAAGSVLMWLPVGRPSRS